MSTLLLDTVTWDLLVDASGNIAVATAPYANAQDAASAIKLFKGELWYDTTKGVPYLTEILAKLPPASLIKARLTQAAESMPGVDSAVCFLTGVNGRRVTGQVQVTGTNGETSVASF